ncbi:unnamed protein product [Hymenolepis diminuta]|uniref:Uncharacterized protein n=1 Tax=Hymenolepis diminuta TaxID=6216 RepID=A0A564ZFD0_HYMDI|nr:unnamed protein product [Hymenolepis diminuta]
MQKLQAIPIHPVSNSIFILHDLGSCSHIFLRHDAALKPLHPIDDGPFPVLKRGEMTFTILQDGEGSAVSVDCLKPTYLDKLTPKNVISVFSSHSPVKQTKNPIQ